MEPGTLNLGKILALTALGEQAHAFESGLSVGHRLISCEWFTMKRNKEMCFIASTPLDFRHFRANYERCLSTRSHPIVIFYPNFSIYKTHFLILFTVFIRALFSST